jgi:cytochrome b6-f complex iron-sulfur subunit
MNRKDFIKTCCLAGMGGLGIELLEGCASSGYYAIHSIIGEQLSLNKSEFTKVVKDKTVQRKFVLLKSEKYNFPICVYKQSEHQYTALLMECTHKSCELQPHGEYLICPCHGSEFNNTGEVQNPPAEINLKTFKVTNDNEKIYIAL